MHPNDITGAIIDCSMEIHRKLGPGLFESVYRRILVYELRKRGFAVQNEIMIPVEWDGVVFDEGFRADIIVNETVMVETKSV